MAKLYGDIKIKVNNQKSEATIENLYLADDEVVSTTVDIIIEKLKEKNIVSGFDKEIIEFYIEKANFEQRLLKDVIIACEKKPLKENSQDLDFSFDCSIQPFDSVKWGLIDRMVRDFDIYNMSMNPIEFYYFNNGEKIANLVFNEKDVEGLDLSGEKIAADTKKNVEFLPGEGVFFDEKSKSFVAGNSGYLSIKNNTLHLRNPIYVTNDKMKLYFKNFKRQNDKFINKRDFSKFIRTHKIPKKFVNNDVFEKEKETGEHYLFAQGIEPEESVDGKILFQMSIDLDFGKKDAYGNIDFKEKTSYKNIKEDDLIVKKQLPVQGKNGYNIYDEVIKASTPKDVTIKNGLNTKIIESKGIVEIISTIDGVLDISHEIYSVFPEVKISGDIDYETGNIDSKANLVIGGNVRSGFKVITKKNIIISGTVENNAYVQAGGSIEIKGGIIGEDTIVKSGENLSVKFIESCKISSGGSLLVQRFIMGAQIECYDKIVILGTGINLKERGCLVDSIIKVKHSLTTPAIGCHSALENEVYFGYDKNLIHKIERMEETQVRLESKINEINDQYDFDILAKNVHTYMKNLNRYEKDNAIKDINKIKQINDKLKMMEGILKKDIAVRENILENCYVEISQVVFAPVIFHVLSKQKTIDKLVNHKKYYFDIKERIIKEESDF